MKQGNLLSGLNIYKPRRAKKLQIETHRLVNTQLIGSFRSMVRGRGLEFEGYRQYIPGHDDAKTIDWAASTRSDRTLVKEFKEERDITLMFLINAGSSMVFSSHDKLKIEYGLEVFSSIAYNALAAGDRVGAVIYGDKMIKHITPAMGKRQYYRMMDALTDTRVYGGPSDLFPVLKYIAQRLRRNSILFVLSDFIHDYEGAQGALSMAALKYDTIGLMVRDPRDMQMPTEDVGEVVIEDPLTGERLLISPHELQSYYKAAAEEQAEAAKQTFIKSKASFIQLNTAEEYMPKLINFFKSRSTQWK